MLQRGQADCITILVLLFCISAAYNNLSVAVNAVKLPTMPPESGGFAALNAPSRAIGSLFCLDLL